MRIIILSLIFMLGACSKSKSADAPVEAASFVPKTCSYAGTIISDGSYEPSGSSVDKYACTSELTNMDCFAYAIGQGYLRLFCELKSTATAQGVPTGCEKVEDLSTGHHTFLDGSALASEVYDCGVLNDNLRCFYFRNSSSQKEEVRCNLM